MYAIRASGNTLQVSFSDVVPTEEALRAISQAFALADAGSIAAAICDLRDITRGPANSLVVAAALASRYRMGMRVAFIASPGQVPFIRRVARASGIREGLGVFDSIPRAESWLAARGSESRGSRRHVEELLRARTSQPAPRRHGAA